MKVKLNTKLDREALRLYDYETGKYLAPKKFGTGEAFTVEDSRFVRDKIRTGELEVVEAGKASTTAPAGGDQALGSNATGDAEIIAAREALATAGKNLAEMKEKMQAAQTNDQRDALRDAVNAAGKAFGEAKAELIRLEKLAG